MEQIKAMIAEMSKDKAFGGEMAALMKDGGIAAIIAAAGAKGFVFTEADWQAYIDWSKSLNAGTSGKELMPEELDNISGGGAGAPWDPQIGDCWFHAADNKVNHRHGRNRVRCSQFACNAMIGAFWWAQCGCRGTDKCVDNWHYADGCPNCST